MRLLVTATTCLSMFILGGAFCAAQAPLYTTGPRSQVYADSVSAPWVNPAIVPWQSDWAAMATIADPRASGDLSFAGAVSASLPFGLGISLGAARATSRSGVHSAFVANFAMVRGRAWALALTTRLDRPAPSADLAFDTDLHITWRAHPRFGVSLAATGAWGLWQRLDGRPAPTLSTAMALRPYGSSSLRLELGASIDADQEWGLRSYLGLEIPHVGQLHMGWRYTHDAPLGPAHMAELGLQVAYGHLQGEGGASLAADESAPSGWYASGGITGLHQRGLPTPRFIREITMEGSVDARSIIGWVRVLDRSLHDRRVAGVLLRVRRTDLTLAYAQELRLMVAALQEAGKRVACVLDSPTGPEAYLCAAAERRLMDPAGVVRWTGVSSRRVLLGGALQNLGVRADFLRIGQYKDAVEALTNRQSTTPSSNQRMALVRGAATRMGFDVAHDLSVSRADAAQLLSQGPYTSAEAVEHQIVNGLADGARVSRHIEPLFGSRLPLRSSPPGIARDAGAGGVPIGVVVIDENIVDGDNVDIPFVDVHATGGDTIVSAIDALAADDAIRVIIIRVDSPGGSALASDQIWRAIRRAKERKPVIASMGRVAASGGYYAACAADEIWANPSTLTGSIGIFMGKVDIVPLATRLGVHTELDSSGARAGALSMWAPFTADQRSVLAELLRDGYMRFLRRVSEGRGTPVAEIHELAQGRVWTGDAAQELGLVDRLGGFGAALARARELADLEPDAEVVVLPRRPRGLLDYVLPRSGTQVRAPAAIRQSLRRWWSVLAAPPDGALTLMPEDINL